MESGSKFFTLHSSLFTSAKPTVNPHHDLRRIVTARPRTGLASPSLLTLCIAHASMALPSLNRSLRPSECWALMALAAPSVLPKVSRDSLRRYPTKCDPLSRVSFRQYVSLNKK